MKHILQIIGIILLLTIIFSVFNIVTANNDFNITKEYDLEWYEHQIEFYKKNQENAYNMAEAARRLGYTDSHNIIVTAKEEWTRAQFYIEELSLKIENLKAEEEAKLRRWKEEYPVATEIWLYLDSKGYNDYVKAGILGNMMAEAGGQTLAIQVDAYSPGYYGICQWSLKYYPQVKDTDLNAQLDILLSTIEYEFNVFGKLYKKGFSYNTFTTMLNEKEAALAFAKSYEKCASGSYSVRKKNATKAYNYFTS